MIKIVTLYILILLSGGYIYPQNNNIVDVNYTSVRDSANYFTVIINLNIKKGWHLNSNKPLDDYLTPTKAKLRDTSGIKIINIEYPPEMITKLQFSDSDLSLYEGMVTIKVHLFINDIFLKIKKKVEVDIEYQSCNNQTCLFPVQKTLFISL